MYDVIIVGAGPAGLSAALILGRCRRKVLVLDSGEYRNYASHGLHGFLTRDGVDPAELRRIGCEQLGPYGVEYRRTSVTGVAPATGSFEVVLEDGGRECSRMLLLATGVSDRLPAVEGAREIYGRSLFHCPYCDGWEMRDQPLAVYGKGNSGAGLALSLKTWSADVVLCTDGPAGLKPNQAERLTRHHIPVREARVTRFEGRDGTLERIVFADGSDLPRRGVFFNTGQDQRCDLAAKLGCRFTRKGAVMTGKFERTNVAGLFVAGDASKDVQLAIVAAAEGAKAGFAINTALQDQEHV